MVRRGKQGPCLSEGTTNMGSSAGQTGWTDVKTIDNQPQFNSYKTNFQTPGIVSPTEFRGFWITTEMINNQLVIKVGKDGESAPFMTGVDEKPLEIRYVGLSAFTDEATGTILGQK